MKNKIKTFIIIFTITIFSNTLVHAEEFVKYEDLNGEILYYPANTYNELYSAYEELNNTYEESRQKYESEINTLKQTTKQYKDDLDLIYKQIGVENIDEIPNLKEQIEEKNTELKEEKISNSIKNIIIIILILYATFKKARTN